MSENKEGLSDADKLDRLSAFLQETTPGGDLEALREEYRSAGEDPDETAQRMRAAIRRARTAPTPAAAPAPAAGEDAARRAGDLFSAVRTEREALSPGLPESAGADIRPGNHGVVVPWRRWASGPRGYHAALVASLLVVIAGGGWFRTWQHARQQQADWVARQTTLQNEISTLKSENRQLRAAQDQGQPTPVRPGVQILDVPLPRLNPQIEELESTGPTVRQPKGAPLPKIRIDSANPTITFILQAEHPTRYDEYYVELRNAENQVLWGVSGLRRTNKGGYSHYTIDLPTAWLATKGPYTLVVYSDVKGRRHPLNSYIFGVESHP